MAVAQKERELIGERTRAGLAAARGARGKPLDGTAAAGSRRAVTPRAAARVRQHADRIRHRLALELEAVRIHVNVYRAAIARAIMDGGVPTPPD